MRAPDSVAETYTALLATHLAGARESVLLNAHELGRKAVTGGFGVLDLVSMHHHALRTLATDGGPATSEQHLDMASEFLSEILSPFEMMLRGYRETNSQLVAANRALQAATSEAESANQELEAFSYSVAHDLRAPLRSLNGFSLALLEDYAGVLDETGCQHLEYIRESTEYMARLIDDLLALSRVARSEFQCEPVSLTDIARDVAARLQKSDPERRVEIFIPDGLTGEGDARLLAIALENLIGNAWKYSSKRADARIEVGVTSARNRNAFFVRDNGAGFDMNYAGKLFGVFQRLHSVNEFEGTGIGLATVKRIIDRHGGHIWAEGKMGYGAIFFFTLSGGAGLRQGDRTRA